jgi:hypothetical protein
MRFISLFAGALLLTACATATPSAPSSNGAPPTAPSATSSSQHARLLHAAGSSDAPSVQEIERAFGEADIVRRDGAGAALTYRFENCALLLLFAADGRNTMRLAEAHPSARHGAGAAPSLDQCAAEAAAARRS